MLSSLGYTHPVHPILVHVTVGLVIGSFVFALLGMLFPHKPFFQTVRHCSVLAILIFLPTVLAGIMDWKHFYAGAWIVAIKMKFVLAATLFVVLACVTAMSCARERRTTLLVVLCTLCFFNVVWIGYVGAELVYGGRTPQSPRTARSKEGARLYSTHCGSCHPGGGNTIAPEHPVTGSHVLVDLETFAFWLRNPDPPMPAFSESKIPDNQIGPLYEYILHELDKSGH